APERPKPVRGEARAIQIQNPPVLIQLGTESVDVGGRAERFDVSARVFDFGVLSLRARVPAPDRLAWSEFVPFGVAAGASEAWSLFEHCRDRLLERIRPAIDRLEVSEVSEDYIVYRLYRVEDDAGNPVKPTTLPDEDVARLL